MLSLTLTLLFAQACSVERASVDSNGAQASAGSLLPTISADGRFVAFQSDAPDLVAGDGNGRMDVFVRDLLAGSTARVSVGTGGEGNGDSRAAAISGDGRYVAFESDATNLVAGDANGATDVFVHDRASGQTTLASRAPGGAPGDGPSRAPALSHDGAWLAFESDATDLVAGDGNGVSDVFVRELASGLTQRASRSTAGVEGSEFSRDPALSGDGRFVAFESAASELVPADTNGVADVFLFDRLLGATERVSVDGAGAQVDGRSRFAALSSDARFVAFDSYASELVPGDTNGAWDSFVRDRVAGTLTRASVGAGGSEANDHSYHPSLSADGRWLAFESAATDLVPGDGNGALDLFVHDLLAGGTRRVSVDASGAQATGSSGVPVISGDGGIVAGWSVASDLVPGDTNGVRDVFAHARGCRSGTPFCFGDGSGAPCPCSNPDLGQAGCANSSGLGGVLAEHGSASAALDDLAFVAHRLLANQPCLLFAGTQAPNSGQGLAFGDGLRCAGGAVVRLGIALPGAVGSVAFGPGLGPGGGWLAGDLRRFQAWYRDPAGPCGSGFNLTNGVEVSFTP